MRAIYWDWSFSLWGDMKPTFGYITLRVRGRCLLFTHSLVVNLESTWESPGETLTMHPEAVLHTD